MSASSDTPGAQRLPRGRHGLSRDFVTENQRERIFDSLAAVSAAHGYGEVRVQDITEHAGVSRRTFYDLFADKEQCFLAAYELIMERLIGEVSAAYAAGDRSWPERVATALRTLIQRYASEPNLARLVMVEVLAAGRAALERRDAALRRFATFLDPGKAGLPAEMEGTEVLTQAVIGGLYEALYTYIVDGHTEQLPALVPDLLYCVLVPYLGHAEAIAASDAARLEPPREPVR